MRTVLGGTFAASGMGEPTLAHCAVEARPPLGTGLDGGQGARPALAGSAPMSPLGEDSRADVRVIPHAAKVALQRVAGGAARCAGAAARCDGAAAPCAGRAARCGGTVAGCRRHRRTLRWTVRTMQWSGCTFIRSSRTFLRTAATLLRSGCTLRRTVRTLRRSTCTFLGTGATCGGSANICGRAPWERRRPVDLDASTRPAAAEGSAGLSRWSPWTRPSLRRSA